MAKEHVHTSNQSPGEGGVVLTTILLIIDSSGSQPSHMVNHIWQEGQSKNVDVSCETLLHKNPAEAYLS